MNICEACGCVVAEDMLQEHSDWHDELVTKSELAAGSVANPKRTRLDADRKIIKD
jgi:transcription initiation factor TFIIIB Brf1 subunit/transcription initiation factor TFIIB